MDSAALIQLAQTTLRSPRAAARMIAALPLGREVIWTSLALVAALNALVISAMFVIAPPAMALPSYFQSPLVLFALLAGLMVLYVHALSWVGRALGGQGAAAPLLAAVVWLQALRLCAQLGILLNFVAELLHLPGLFHAAAVLAGAALGVLLGLGLLLSLIGLTAQGV